MSESVETDIPVVDKIKVAAETKEQAVPTKKSERWLPRVIQDGIEFILRKIFFWEEDDKRIGGLIRFLHHGIIFTMVAWYAMIHTIVPSYFLFLVFYCIMFIIWFHHVLIGGCVLSRLEQKFIGDDKSFVDPIMEAFHIPITPESTEGIVILGSTGIFAMLTFELVARTILNIKSWVPFFIEKTINIEL